MRRSKLNHATKLKISVKECVEKEVCWWRK